MTKISIEKVIKSKGKIDEHSIELVSGIVELLEQAKRYSIRAVNSIITATYWEIGRRIVENEQRGKSRAEYGEMIMKHLSKELISLFGKGFSLSNIKQMKKFYLIYSAIENSSDEKKIKASKKGQTVSGFFISNMTESKSQTVSGLISNIENLQKINSKFPLSWSHYVSLLSVKNEFARKFYESESLRGGWSVRQLDRQINSQFYERTALSKNKAAMLIKGSKPRSEDKVTAEEEIKSPFVLEFLGLKDEYSENQLEDALINHLGTFLLELGSDFAFVARQKRLRLDDTWYRVDQVFFHRKLKSLLLIDLKIGSSHTRMQDRCIFI